MLSRLNSRIKSRTETGPGYADLEESSVNDAQSVNGSTSPFSSSSIFSQTENGGLGSAIEMSAAVAGVVPDGMSYIQIADILQVKFNGIP